MDESAKNRARQKRCLALLNAANAANDNEDWARNKMRLPRAMTTIVEENLNTQLRDVNQNVLELLNATGRRLAQCESNATSQDTTSPGSSATNSNVSSTTTASDPSATSHDIDSLTFCSSRKSRSFHFTTSKKSSMEMDDDVARPGRHKRRLKKHTVVSSKGITQKSLSNSEIYNQQVDACPVCIAHRCAKYRQPSILSGIFKSKVQKHSDKTVEQAKKQQITTNFKIPHDSKQRMEEIYGDKVNPSPKTAKTPTSDQLHRQHDETIEEKIRKSRRSKKNHHERAKEKKYRHFSPDSSIDEGQNATPHIKPNKRDSERKNHERKHHEQHTKSSNKSFHKSTQVNHEKQAHEENISKKSKSPSKCKERDQDQKQHHHETSVQRARKPDTEIKAHQEDMEKYRQCKSKKRKEFDPDDQETCNERKKAKREGSLLRIKQSLLQLAGFNKLTERKRSKSKKRNKIVQETPLPSPSIDPAPPLVLPKAQNFEMTIKISATSNLQRFLDHDDADLNKLCSCEPIPSNKKARPTITRADLGSLEIPPYKPKKKKHESRRRHHKHHRRGDSDKVQIDTSTMALEPHCTTKTPDGDSKYHTNPIPEEKEEPSKISAVAQLTMGGILSSYNSFDSVVQLCEKTSMTSLENISNVMIISDLGSIEDNSMSLVKPAFPGCKNTIDMQNLVESLCTTPTFDTCPAFFMEPYCYMTLNTSMNKLANKNRSTNTDLIWVDENLQIDVYSNAIHRAKLCLSHMPKSRKIIFKRTCNNKFLTGRRSKRRSCLDLHPRAIDMKTSGRLGINGRRSFKSRIPVLSCDIALFSTKKSVKKLVRNKSTKPSRIPRLKKTTRSIKSPRIDKDGICPVIDLQSALFDCLSKTKESVNLEEEIFDIYWDDSESLPDVTIYKDAIKAEDNWMTQDIPNSTSSPGLKNRCSWSRSQWLLSNQETKLSSFGYSTKAEPYNNSAKLERQGSQDDLPQKDMSVTKKSSSSLDVNLEGFNSTFNSSVLPDVSALVNIPHKDLSLPSKATTFIVNLADIEDAHMNVFKCNSKAMIEDGLRRISSKLNMEDAIRNSGYGEKQSVSLQVFVPSRHVDTNTSWSTLCTTNSTKKKSFRKSKLPLPVKRSKQTIRNSYTFPIEIDLGKIGNGDHSSSDVSSKSVFWATGKFAAEKSCHIADNISIYGQIVESDKCSSKISKCSVNGEQSSKSGYKLFGFNWWRKMFLNRKPKNVDVNLCLSEFTEVMEVFSANPYGNNSGNKLEKSHSFILTSSKSESVPAILRSLSLGSLLSNNSITPNIWTSKSVIIQQLQKEEEINLESPVDNSQSIKNEKLIQITNYEEPPSPHTKKGPLKSSKTKRKGPVYKIKKPKLRCHKIVRHKKRKTTSATPKIIFDVPLPPEHHDSEFADTRKLLHLAQHEMPLDMNHEAREEAQRKLREYEERVIEREKLAAYKEDRRKTDKQIKEINHEAEQFRDGYEDIYTPITRCDYGMTYFNFKSTLRRFILDAETLRILTPCVKGHMQKAPKEVPPIEVTPILVHVASQTCEQDVTTLVGGYIFPDFEALVAEAANAEDITKLDPKTKDIVDLHAQEEFCFEIYPELDVTDSMLVIETSEPVIDFEPSIGDVSCICPETDFSDDDSASPLENSMEENDFTLKLDLQNEAINVIFKDNEYQIVISSGSFISACDCGGDFAIVLAKQRFLESLYEKLKRNGKFLRNLKQVLINLKQGLKQSNEESQNFTKDALDALLSYNGTPCFDAVKIDNLEEKYSEFNDFKQQFNNDRLATIVEESEPIAEPDAEFVQMPTSEQIENISKRQETSISKAETGDESTTVHLEKTSFSNLLSLHNSSSCTSLDNTSKTPLNSLKSCKSCTCTLNYSESKKQRRRKCGVIGKIDLALGDDGLDKIACLCRRPLYYTSRPVKNNQKLGYKTNHPPMELERFYTLENMVPIRIIRYFYSCTHVVVRHPPILWVLAKKLVRKRNPNKCPGRVCKDRPSRTKSIGSKHRSSSRNLPCDQSCSSKSVRSSSSKKHKKHKRHKHHRHQQSSASHASTKSSSHQKKPHDDVDDHPNEAHCSESNTPETHQKSSSHHKKPSRKRSARFKKQTCRKKRSRCKSNASLCADPTTSSVQFRVECPNMDKGLLQASSAASSTDEVLVVHNETPTPELSRDTSKRYSEPVIIKRSYFRPQRIDVSVSRCGSIASFINATADYQEIGCGHSFTRFEASSSMTDDEKRIFDLKILLTPDLDTPPAAAAPSNQECSKLSNISSKTDKTEFTTPGSKPASTNELINEAFLNQNNVVSQHSKIGTNPVDANPIGEKESVGPLLSLVPASDLTSVETVPGGQDFIRKDLSSEEPTVYPVTTQTTIIKTQPLISMTVLTDETAMMDQQLETCSFVSSQIQTLLSFKPSKTKRTSWLTKMATFRRLHHKDNLGACFPSFDNLLPGMAQTSITLLPTIHYPHAFFAAKRQFARLKKQCACRKDNDHRKKVKELLPAKKMPSSTDSLPHSSTTTKAEYESSSDASPRDSESPTSHSSASSEPAKDLDWVVHKIADHPPIYVRIKTDDPNFKEELKKQQSKPLHAVKKQETSKPKGKGVVKLTAEPFDSVDSKDISASVKKEAGVVLSVKGSSDCCKQTGEHSKQKTSKQSAKSEDVHFTVEELPASKEKEYLNNNKLNKLYLYAQYVQTDFEVYESTENDSKGNLYSGKRQGTSIGSSIPTVHRIKKVDVLGGNVETDYIDIYEGPTKVAEATSCVFDDPNIGFHSVSKNVQLTEDGVVKKMVSDLKETIIDPDGKMKSTLKEHLEVDDDGVVNYKNRLKEIGTDPETGSALRRLYKVDTHGDKTVEIFQDNIVDESGVKTTRQVKAVADAGVTTFEEQMVEIQPNHSGKVANKIFIRNDANTGRRVERTENIVTNSGTRMVMKSSRIIGDDADQQLKITPYTPIVSKIAATVSDIIHHKNSNHSTKGEGNERTSKFVDNETMTIIQPLDPSLYADEATSYSSGHHGPTTGKKSNLKPSNDEADQVTIIKHDTKSIQFPRNSQISRLKYITNGNDSPNESGSKPFVPYSASQAMVSNDTSAPIAISSQYQLGNKRKLSYDQSLQAENPKRRKDELRSESDNNFHQRIPNMCCSFPGYSNGKGLQNNRGPQYISSPAQTENVPKKPERSGAGPIHHNVQNIQTSSSGNVHGKAQFKEQDTLTSKPTLKDVVSHHPDPGHTKFQERGISPENSTKKAGKETALQTQQDNSFVTESRPEFKRTHSPGCIPKEEMAIRCPTCTWHHRRKCPKNVSCASVRNYGCRGCCRMIWRPPRYVFKECCDAETIKDFYKMGPTKFMKLYPETCWPKLVPQFSDDSPTRRELPKTPNSHVDTSSKPPNIRKKIEYIFDDDVDDETIEMFYKVGLEQFKKMYPKSIWPQKHETMVSIKDDTAKQHKNTDAPHHKSKENSELLNKHEYVLKECCDNDMKAKLAKLGYEKFVQLYPKCCISELNRTETQPSLASRIWDESSKTCKRCCMKCRKKKLLCKQPSCVLYRKPLLQSKHSGKPKESVPQLPKFEECCDEGMKKDWLALGDKEFKKVHPKCCWPAPEEDKCCDRDPAKWNNLIQSSKEAPEKLSKLPPCCSDHAKQLLAKSNELESKSIPDQPENPIVVTRSTSHILLLAPPPSRELAQKSNFLPEKIDQQHPRQSIRTSVPYARIVRHSATGDDFDGLSNSPKIVIEQKQIGFPQSVPSARMRKISNINYLGNRNYAVDDNDDDGEIEYPPRNYISSPNSRPQPYDTNPIFKPLTRNVSTECIERNDFCLKEPTITNPVRKRCMCNPKNINSAKGKVGTDTDGICTCKKHKSQKVPKDPVTFTALDLKHVSQNMKRTDSNSLLQRIDTIFAGPRSTSEPNLATFEHEFLQSRTTSYPKRHSWFKPFVPSPEPNKLIKTFKLLSKLKKRTNDDFLPRQNPSLDMHTKTNQQVMSIHSKIKIREDSDHDQGEIEEIANDGDEDDSSISDIGDDQRERSNTPQDERNIKFLEEIDIIDLKKHRKLKTSFRETVEEKRAVDDEENEQKHKARVAKKVEEAEEASIEDEHEEEEDEAKEEDIKKTGEDSYEGSEDEENKYNQIQSNKRSNIISKDSVDERQRSSIKLIELGSQENQDRSGDFLQTDSTHEFLPLKPVLKPDKTSPQSSPIKFKESRTSIITPESSTSRDSGPILELLPPPPPRRLSIRPPSPTHQVTIKEDEHKEVKKLQVERSASLISLAGDSLTKEEVIEPLKMESPPPVKRREKKTNKSLMEWMLTKLFDTEHRPFRKKAKQQNKLMTMLFGKHNKSKILPASHLRTKTFSCGCSQASGKLCRCDGIIKQACNCKKKKTKDQIVEYSFVENTNIYANNNLSLYKLQQTSYKSLFEMNHLARDDFSPEFDHQTKLSTIEEYTEQDHDDPGSTSSSNDEDEDVKENMTEIIDIFKRLHTRSPSDCRGQGQTLANRLPHILTKSEMLPNVQVFPTTVSFPKSTQGFALERENSKMTRLIRRVKCSLSKLKIRKSKQCNSLRVSKRSPSKVRQSFTAPKPPKPSHSTKSDFGKKEEIRIGGTSYIIKAPRYSSKGDQPNSQRKINSEGPSLRSFESPRCANMAGNTDLGVSQSKYDAVQELLNQKNLDQILKLQKEISWINQHISGKYRNNALRLLLDASQQVKQQLQNTINKRVEFTSMATLTKPEIAEKAVEVQPSQSDVKKPVLSVDKCKNCLSIPSTSVKKKKEDKDSEERSQKELMEFRELIRGEREKIRKEGTLRKKAVPEVKEKQVSRKKDLVSKKISENCHQIGGPTGSNYILGDSTPTKETSSNKLETEISNAIHLLAQNPSSDGEGFLSVTENADILSTYVPNTSPVYPVFVNRSFAPNTSTCSYCDTINTESEKVLFKAHNYNTDSSSNATNISSSYFTSSNSSHYQNTTRMKAVHKTRCLEPVRKSFTEDKINRVEIPFEKILDKQNCNKFSASSTSLEAKRDKIRLRLQFVAPYTDTKKKQKYHKPYILEKISNTSYSTSDTEYILKVHNYNMEGTNLTNSEVEPTVAIWANRNLTNSRKPILLSSTTSSVIECGKRSESFDVESRSGYGLRHCAHNCDIKHHVTDLHRK